MALSQTLRKARELLATGWNPECTKSLTPDGYAVYSDPVYPGRLPTLSYDIDGALRYACHLLGEPGATWVAAEEFLDGLVPRPHPAFTGLVCLWEKEPGRTQREVVELFQRAILRAQRVEAAT